MDKAKSLKGVIKVKKNDKQVLTCPSADKDKQFFQVEANDFPSLSELRDKNPKAEKGSTCSASSLTYSSKLKTLPAECPSQNMKFVNSRYNEHVESVTSKRPSKNESSLSQASGGRQVVNSPRSVQPNHYHLTKQSSSPTAPSGKKFTDSKSNSSFSEMRHKKSESFNRHTNIKAPYEQKSMKNNTSSKAAHGEPNTFEKIRHSPQKSHNLQTSTSSNVQKPSYSKNLSNPEYSSSLRNDMSHKKESNRSNISAQHRMHFEANRSVNSMASSGQVNRLLQVNAAHSNASRNDSNKAREYSSPGSQMANNSLKTENSKFGNYFLNVQSSLSGSSDAKKKKKRKSKLKRQAALQTGKILVLTPEVHSKIVSQSNNVCIQKHQNILTNINDSEEYPELGLSDSKNMKKTHSTVKNVFTKEENPISVRTLGSETDKKENDLVSKDSATSDILEAVTASDEKSKALVEKPEGEKTTIHSNNPITLSLFDMLAAAKSRKKEPEKKDESIDENNSSVKVFKKEIIKKNVSQAVNPFASSKPTIKRGKEREKPKIKRPSRMRKLILMERQLRKENMAKKLVTESNDNGNEEKSVEILPAIHSSDEMTKFSAPENLETCVENLLNYIVDTENSCETYEIYDDLCNKASKLFAIEYENFNFQPTSENQDVSEQSKLINEQLNDTNETAENRMNNFSDNKKDFGSINTSVVDIQTDLVSNSDSNLTDNEKSFVEDVVDVDIVENLAKNCSTIKPEEKYSDLKNNMSDVSCVNENFMGSDRKTENTHTFNNFTNELLETKGQLTDLIEDSKANTAAACDVNTKLNVLSGQRNGLTDSGQSNVNLQYSEKSSIDISENSFTDEEKLKATKFMLHSRKFRLYCNHFISKEIDQAVFSLIDDLARFQDRMYQKDPVKAKVRRRLVYGIKEIKKHMKLKKVKCIIIATDIEDIKIEGGLNDSLGELISLAEAYHIPCVFSHRRFNLGKVCRKSVPVSCVGIFNYEGSEKNFKKMIELHDDSKHDYLEVTKQLASELTNNQVNELFEAEKESILFLREVSQRILKEKIYFTPEEYRNSETTELTEKSTNIESEDSVMVLPLQSEDSKTYLSFTKCAEELKKLGKEENLQLNETGINTILVKYKVVKEC